MIRSYECIDNPERPLDEKVLTDPKLMANYAREGKYISLPVVPIISICLGAKFENGRTAYPIYENIDEVELNINYDNPEFKAMMDALEILNPKETVIEIRGPISVLDNLLGATKVMRSMRKNRDTLKTLYKQLADIYIYYIKMMLEKGVKVFSFTESILDVNVLGPREVSNYVDDFLIGFLHEILDLQNQYDFTFHLCPKSSLALVDLAKADFRSVSCDPPKKYIDILYDQKSLMGDRCINLADKEFSKVNTIVLKEE